MADVNTNDQKKFMSIEEHNYNNDVNVVFDPYAQNQLEQSLNGSKHINIWDISKQNSLNEKPRSIKSSKPIYRDKINKNDNDSRQNGGQIQTKFSNKRLSQQTSTNIDVLHQFESERQNRTKKF